MLNRNRGNNILELTKRPSPIKEGVPSYREEPLFASKKRPLYSQTEVFTPLSIRRGDGGEAVEGMWRSLSSLLKRALSLMNNGLDDDLTLLSLCENLRCDLRNILFREGLEDRF